MKEKLVPRKLCEGRGIWQSPASIKHCVLLGSASHARFGLANPNRTVRGGIYQSLREYLGKFEKSHYNTDDLQESNHA